VLLSQDNSIKFKQEFGEQQDREQERYTTGMTGTWTSKVTYIHTRPDETQVATIKTETGK